MDWNSILAFLERIFAFNAEQPLLFTQFYFWAFFAVVMLFFSFLHSKLLLRNSFLLFVSLFFYFKTSGMFVLILIFDIFVNFFIGKGIYRASTRKKKNAWVLLALVLNLGVLFYFKYAYFFADVINSLLGTHIQVVNYLALWANNLTGSHFTVDKILLPVGISFYTFQTISYIMDVYRKKIEPVANILDFGFYVSFFPQLVAGPIVRANEFVPQLHTPYFLSRKQFGIAVFWILNGLAKKMILSDYLAVNFIDRVFSNPLMFTGFENLFALFAYSLQVYADFSGYTDIAIGVASLMGFKLPQNFNSPYKAVNPGNFWKRWHMSLSKWLQNYLYIPLGGNRNATFGTFFILAIILLIAMFLVNNVWVSATIIAVMLVVALVYILVPSARKAIYTNINRMDTMLLGGLWHGASWNFMIWGGLNGMGMLAFEFWKRRNHYMKAAVTLALFVLMLLLWHFMPAPIFKIGVVWTGMLFVGALFSMLYHAVVSPQPVKWLSHAWAVFTTFVFITFTRLFFRSGSNLDPAIANEEAWNTAKNMVTQIGGLWDMSLIGTICASHYKVILLFVLGMIIHWLPDRWKRWYRYNFAAMPIPVILLAVVVTVFVVYQFVTADFQAFIYFQF